MPESTPSGIFKTVITDTLGNLLPVSGGGTAVGATSGNVAAGVATATATIAAVAGKTNYLTGFEITGGGATGASIIVATVVGLLGGTRSYCIAVPAGATLGIQPLIVSFDTPIPASAANVAIVVSAPSFGAGNTNACVNASGYQV